MRKVGSAGAIPARRATVRRIGSVPARAAATACALLAAGAIAESAAQGAPLRDSPRGSSAARAAAARPSLPYNGTITGIDRPYAVAFNRYSRKIYVTESGRDRVAVFDRLGRRRGTFGQGALRAPTALAFDFAGNLAVLSAASREIVLFRPGGSLIGRAGVPAASPLGIAYEPASRRLLVTDTLADSVWTTLDGRTWRQERPPGLTAPVGAAAAGGRFYVVSSADARLMELSSSGGLIRAVGLRGARRPLGVTFPPFGNELVVSSSGDHSGLFASRPGGRLARFGGRSRLDVPVLPGSECSRVAFPDVTRNRVVAFDLPGGAGCAQALALRGATTARGFRRIVATIEAESDGRVSAAGRVSVPSARGRAKRYRLRRMSASLVAGARKRVRIAVPGAAAAGIRRALARRRTSTVTLTFDVRSLAGDRRRVTGRLLYRPRALASAARRAPVALKVAP